VKFDKSQSHEQEQELETGFLHKETIEEIKFSDVNAFGKALREF